jgi:hypothetical protein
MFTDPVEKGEEGIRAPRRGRRASFENRLLTPDNKAGTMSSVSSGINIFGGGAGGVDISPRAGITR